ncbi:MAG: hypothetical protein IKK81_11770 [Prevotella sp.]|nr:hypothetical protein [Prevotella sp.]
MKKLLLTIITIAFCLNLSGHSSCFIDKSNMIYENNVLKKILNDDGYIMLNDTRISLLSERPLGQQPCGGGEDGRF